MNHWLKLSIEYANQRSYLDDLFQVYPTIPEGIRDIDEAIWGNVEEAFYKKDNIRLIKELLKLDLFPIKDSYIACLRHDPNAVYRNPKTVNRVCGRLYELGLTQIFARCSEPKETNRQIGPMFRNWLSKKSLGIEPIHMDDFVATEDDAILDAGDTAMQVFAREHLNYKHGKGLDFIARFNKKYVIGETKFLTDYGGHQKAQFNDAIRTITAERVNAIQIAILDGVLFIINSGKKHA